MRRRPPLPWLLLLPITFFLIFTFYSNPNPSNASIPLLHHTHHHLHLVNDNSNHLPTPLPTNISSTTSLLLPDWNILVSTPTTQNPSNFSCLFQNGHHSPAFHVGEAGYRCVIPPAVRRLRPILTPRLVSLSKTDKPNPNATETIRWNRPHVYLSLSTVADVIVFAKGINNRQGVNHDPDQLLCVFLSDNVAVATTAVTSSAQQVFRCNHPSYDITDSGHVTVTIQYRESNVSLPTLAVYRRPGVAAAVPRAKICACTMVLNAAKFLREWVVYHAGIGVERFVLYDNGSDDGLEEVVNRLSGEGFNVSTRFWPWPKTQEAGFSHSVAVDVADCEWMAFIDVDEFIFSPGWTGDKPDRSMLGSLVMNRTGSEQAVGQVTLSCRDFGPSGQRKHPSGGVTQGYICRRRVDERHKSIVLLEAVDRSLINSVHHFVLATGRRTRRVKTAVVNHYKYQAWEEFKVKFRRRVSAYVVDWREAANAGSKDRTPGLGFKAVEPEGWAEKFCEISDTRLRDTTRRWFGEEGGGGQYKMVWEE